MLWFLLGAGLGAVASAWFCYRQWAHFESPARSFREIVYEAHRLYELRRWRLVDLARQGVLPPLPEHPPTVTDFMYYWGIGGRNSLGDYHCYLGALSNVDSACAILSRIDDLLCRPCRDERFRRRVERLRAYTIRDILSASPLLEARRGDPTMQLGKVGIPERPIDLSQYQDVDREDEEFNRTEHLRERLEWARTDLKDAEENLAALRDLPPDILTPQQRESDIQLTIERIEELKSAISEGRIPDLED